LTGFPPGFGGVWISKFDLRGRAEGDCINRLRMKGIEIITTLTPVLFSFMFFRIVLYRYADIYEINTNNWYYRIQSLNQQTQMKNTSIALGEHFDQYIAEQLASGRYRTASELIRESLRMHQERELKILVMRAAIEDGIASGIDESFSFEGLNRELDAELGS
jgi:antitoxin ParD1/3/4